MTIRLAVEADIPTIQKIAYATWPPTFDNILSKEQIDYMLGLMYNTEELSNRMSHPKRDFYILDYEGEPVAFLVIEKDYNGEKKFKIEKVYVLPEKHGQGIGKRLFAFTEERMKEEGYSILILDVNRDNPAVQFYQNRGFKILGIKDTDIGNGFLMEDYEMRKDLPR